MPDEIDRPGADAFIHQSRILNVQTHQRDDAPRLVVIEHGTVPQGVADPGTLGCRGRRTSASLVLSYSNRFHLDGNPSRWVTHRSITRHSPARAFGLPPMFMTIAWASERDQ